jgi:hypothetical protein
MATIADEPDISVDSLRFLTNSNAVALSRPLVLLSQHCKGLWPRALLNGVLVIIKSVLSHLEGYLRFGNADTLPLSSRNSSNEVVSNFGVQRVTKAKYSHNDISHVVGILLSGNTWYSVSGSYKRVSESYLAEDVNHTSGPSSELKGLSNCQLWEMNINFSLINAFSSEIVMHLFH